MKTTIKGLATLMVLITATMFSSCNKNEFEFESVSSDKVVTITITPPSADATKVMTTETASMLSITGWESGDIVYLYKLGNADNDYTKVEFSCTDASSGKFTGTLPSGVNLEDLTFAVYNATVGEYSYNYAEPSFSYMQLIPKSKASTNAKDVIVMTAINTGSGFRMKVVNNIVKIINSTASDVEAAWKWDDGGYYTHLTKMAIKQDLHGNLGYQISSVTASEVSFEAEKFTLKANSHNYLFMFPGATSDSHKIGLSKKTDYLNAATLISFKVVSALSATGGKLYSAPAIGPTDIIDLSATATANSYIVPAVGKYKFKGNVKGNSSTALDGTPVSAEVLWESFGTSTAPSVGDIVNTVSFDDGYVSFTATGKKGNAVIAVKDDDSNILWSWHIWCTDVPVGQVYNNGAGIMMDRNLGATSATPGDVHALGLFYQWGRKDPFLGSSSISSANRAASTLSWPECHLGAMHIEWTVANPTTFITLNDKNTTHYDWDSKSFSGWYESFRWESTKTIYDPCPQGWRVPTGGGDKAKNEWTKAFDWEVAWKTPSNWDNIHKGMNLGSTDRTLGTGTIWYPATGQIDSETGNIEINEYGWLVGESGLYWACSCYEYQSYSLIIDNEGDIYPRRANYWRANGRAVRCVKE